MQLWIEPHFLSLGSFPGRGLPISDELVREISALSSTEKR